MNLWLALLCVAALPCTAARVAPVEVRSGHAGAACFTIPHEQERRTGAPQFDAITVTDVASPRVPLWYMAMPRERTFAVTFRMCIPYGGRLPVLPQTPAATLTSGRVYEVAIAARAPAIGAPRIYRSRFCLRGRTVMQLAPGALPACPA